MSNPHQAHPAPNHLTSFYWSDELIRSRSVSDIVLTNVLDVPVPPLRLVLDWEREIASNLELDPGDVEALPLARARARWPDYAGCVQTMSDWTSGLGLPDVLAASDIALMACRGAKYHHDGAQYGGAAFCNLFISEDLGLDVHFPAIDKRIPLTRGTALMFDTGQPHGVIRRGRSDFHVDDFPPELNWTQVFLTWELPIEDFRVSHALQITFDTAPLIAHQLDEEQIRLNDARVQVCPESGRWLGLA